MVTSKKPSPGASDDESRDREADTGSTAPTQPFPYDPPFYTAPVPETQSLPSADPVAVPSFVRRHPVAMGITAAALAVVVLSGLTAWGVGTAVASSYEAGASAAVAPATSAPRVAGKKGLAAGRTMVRGTIDEISGSTWTITSRAGATQRVTIGKETLYGSEKVPASASDFAVGSAVLIVEKTAGDVRTAVQVVAAKKTPVPSPGPVA